jgi:hypothetical protein
MSQCGYALDGLTESVWLWERDRVLDGQQRTRRRRSEWLQGLGGVHVERSPRANQRGQRQFRR